MLAALTAITLSSLGFAGLDALRKVLAGRLEPVPLATLLTIGQMPLFVAWALLAGETGLAAGYAVPGVATVLLNVAANVLFLRAVQVSPLSLTIPFLSLTPVFSTLIATSVLGEWPGDRQSAGIALVVLGAFMVNVRRDRPSPFVALRRERGSLIMVGVALKRALAFADVPMHAAIQCAGVAAFLIAYLALRGRLGELREVRTVRRVYALSLVAAAVGLGLQFVALRLTLVGLVEALKRAIGMFFAVVVGRLAFEEAVTTGKVAGVALMSVGVFLIVS